MEESRKEISMREYPVGHRQDNRTAAVADIIYVYLLLEWMVEISFLEGCPSTIRIGERSNSAVFRSRHYGWDPSGGARNLAQALCYKAWPRS